MSEKPWHRVCLDCLCLPFKREKNPNTFAAGMVSCLFPSTLWKKSLVWYVLSLFDKIRINCCSFQPHFWNNSILVETEGQMRYIPRVLQLGLRARETLLSCRKKNVKWVLSSSSLPFPSFSFPCLFSLWVYTTSSCLRSDLQKNRDSEKKEQRNRRRNTFSFDQKRACLS